jgi:hypothetical protein
LNNYLQIQLHKEFKKIQPIDIDVLEGKRPISTNTLAEQIMQQSMNMVRDPATGAQKLQFERSPLIKNEISGKPVDIQQTKQPSVAVESNSLKEFSFDKGETRNNLAEMGEKLGEHIRNLGESLSRDLCQKFISQLQLRYKKTNLTEDEIQKAAELYVKQRRSQK